MAHGIYTLANDAVYDQLVALLNSIEANAGSPIPVCVIAYNDHLDKVRAEIDRRSTVTLLEQPDLFQHWEEFSYQVWATHPTALQTWRKQGIPTRFYRVGENHRYCAFDPISPFEKFVYLDCDTLLLGPLDFVFDQLNHSDFVVYDFQHKDITHIFNPHSEKLLSVFSQKRLETEIFCSGFYGSKRGLFSPQEQDWIIEQLRSGEAEILYPKAPNQSVLNYMAMRCGKSIYNVALQRSPQERAGNSVTSAHFEERDHVLYDKQVRLTYLHYIGLSSQWFKAVCAGENINFPYRDIFLHYRYLHTPQERPALTGKPKHYNQPPSLPHRIAAKAVKLFARG